MQIFRDLSETQLTSPTVLTIGTFDGIHRGHQALIAKINRSAQNQQAQSAVLAFHPRPKAIFAPHKFNNDYLSTPEERIAYFEALGLDILLLIPFTPEISQVQAYDFVKILVNQLKMVELWAGYDFALGKDRAGDVDTLRTWGKTFNYRLSDIEPVIIDGKAVSSTRIRKMLQMGDVAGATNLLGRYPSIQGTIVKGHQRGRTIGFPTANLDTPPERLIPANGVYATFVQRPGDPYKLPSVTNIGVRPSFEGDAPTRTIEAHIFDFAEDIYDQTVTLEFVQHLRPEKKFDGIDALIAQIGQDADQARALLAETV
ncbi:MAG: bifunctional riboflavin kinase/FAD synthetase [Chloroflexota bacterium]